MIGGLKMGRYYLYGAGINCVGVVKFYGVENILGIIDSDKNKQGKKFEGIDIISLQQYIEEGNNAPIIITAYFQNASIKKILQCNGITNYYVSTYMQTGFYENVEEIIEKFNLIKYQRVCFVTKNPISELMFEECLKREYNLTFIYLDEEQIFLNENDIIFVTNEEEKNKSKKYPLELVKDINEIYSEKYAFKNPNLRKFKDIHKGKRCFIIGNGPSLRYEDLETLYLNNEICFAANRIFRAYDNTNWRPDYYLLIDYMLYELEKENIKDMSGIRFIRHFYNVEGFYKDENLYEMRGAYYVPGKPEFSWDIENGVYIGNSVIYDALQIAVYMGFKEIYFLGVDMTFKNKSGDEIEHFYKDKKKDNLPVGNIDEVILALEYARRVLDEQEIKLKNATRGGELEVLERVEFDSLFKK